VALKKAAQRVAEAKSTVLIQGETGTGKGVLARALHRMGPRANEAFVDLNCAGLSRELLESELFGHQKGAFTGAVANKIGFLEAANHGTLFLDEIGDMDLQIQAKVLKVVEEKHFYRLGDVVERKTDMQIIVASHRDLKTLADEGKISQRSLFPHQYAAAADPAAARAARGHSDHYRQPGGATEQRHETRADADIGKCARGVAELRVAGQHS
jgi:DNA-binding NtrC family response regulator